MTRWCNEISCLRPCVNFSKQHPYMILHHCNSQLQWKEGENSCCQEINPTSNTYTHHTHTHTHTEGMVVVQVTGWAFLTRLHSVALATATLLQWSYWNRDKKIRTSKRHLHFIHFKNLNRCRERGNPPWTNLARADTLGTISELPTGSRQAC